MFSIRMLRSFSSELEKSAAKVPFIHGTFGPHKVLIPGAVSKVLASDPNPQAVYTAMRGRGRRLRSIKDFAVASARRHGGEPVIAHGKMDTAKGWLPTTLSESGKKTIGTIDAAHDLVDRLDEITDKKERGKIWKALNTGTGAWRNVDPAAQLKPTKYVKVAKQ